MAAAAVMRPEEERLFQGQPKGFPLGDFAVEDVMLPEVPMNRCIAAPHLLAGLNRQGTGIW